MAEPADIFDRPGPELVRPLAATLPALGAACVFILLGSFSCLPALALHAIGLMLLNAWAFRMRPTLNSERDARTALWLLAGVWLGWVFSLGTVIPEFDELRWVLGLLALLEHACIAGLLGLVGRALERLQLGTRAGAWRFAAAVYACTQVLAPIALATAGYALRNAGGLEPLNALAMLGTALLQFITAGFILAAVVRTRSVVRTWTGSNCYNCRFSLEGLASPRCPECGAIVTVAPPVVYEPVIGEDESSLHTDAYSSSTQPSRRGIGAGFAGCVAAFLIVCVAYWQLPSLGLFEPFGRILRSASLAAYAPRWDTDLPRFARRLGDPYAAASSFVDENEVRSAQYRLLGFVAEGRLSAQQLARVMDAARAVAADGNIPLDGWPNIVHQCLRNNHISRAEHDDFMKSLISVQVASRPKIVRGLRLPIALTSQRTAAPGATVRAPQDFGGSVSVHAEELRLDGMILASDMRLTDLPSRHAAPVVDVRNLPLVPADAALGPCTIHARLRIRLSPELQDYDSNAPSDNGLTPIEWTIDEDVAATIVATAAEALTADNDPANAVFIAQNLTARLGTSSKPDCLYFEHVSAKNFAPPTAFPFRVHLSIDGETTEVGTLLITPSHTCLCERLDISPEQRAAARAPGAKVKVFLRPSADAAMADPKITRCYLGPEVDLPVDTSEPSKP